jgi:hypothetical protein
MRVVLTSVLVGCVSLGSPAVADHAASAVGPGARCPTTVLDAKTSIVDTKSGVDITITAVELKRVEEIRRRAGRLVEATQLDTALLGDLDQGEVPVRYGTATVEDVDGGVKISLRAQTPVAVEVLKNETHQRHQHVLDALAKPHAILLVDTRSSSEVWIDGVDSGYRTPTDGIILPPGEHQVAVQDGSGRRSAPMFVLLRRDDTRRLYVAPAK